MKSRDEGEPYQAAEMARIVYTCAIMCVNQMTSKLKSISSHPWRLNMLALIPPVSLPLFLSLSLTHTPLPHVCARTQFLR